VTLNLMTRISRHTSYAAFVVGLSLLLVTTGQARQSRQRDEVSLVIGDSIGTPPSVAVPDCLSLTPDEATAEAARTIAEVLWADLDFEREFRMIARDIYRTIPAARSLEDIPFDRWRELGADAVVSCTVRATSADQIEITTRLFSVRALEWVFGVQYAGSNRNVRLYAHQLSDEIHRSQRGLEGVARTRIAFVTDRDSESVLGLVENRPVKEIYIADYDGASSRRVTTSRSLNTTPAWSPDGRSIGYTSWLSGFPEVVVSHLYEGRMSRPADGNTRDHNFLPAFSPDGSQIVFMSNRDGNPEIYSVNVDGTDMRRLTNHPAIDTSPTWSPNGQQVAFTSDRTGAPQIYAVGADGTGLRRLTYESYCDRPTWSPAPFNEVAYSSKTGPGHDIKVLDLATNEVRQLTFGLGSNESPSFSPNGRHVAFMSTRGSGLKQIYTIGRDGKGLRRVTSTGNNEMPNWSR
jgi:TolB protein